MAKFYLHDGKEQQGPFDISQLKEKGITGDTYVWNESLEQWTLASKVDELSSIFNKVPPPFNPGSNVRSRLDKQIDSEKAPNKRMYFLAGSFAAIGIIFCFFYFTKESEASTSSTPYALSETMVEAASKGDEDKGRLEELEAKEEKRRLANDFRTSKNMEYRNNWTKYIQHTENDYKVDSWGGISDLQITANNSTDRLIDEVIIEVNYYKENGDIYTTKEIAIKNIQPSSYGVAEVPNTTRGTRISTSISKITSRSLHFCYDAMLDYNQGEGISGNKKDPWICK